MREFETINFHEHEVVKLDMPHDDALVITLELAGTIFSKILVDSGSAVNVISQTTLRSISQPTLVIDHEMTLLNSFEGKSVQSLRIVPLTTRTHNVELHTRFTVDDHFMPFDAIIGRPWLHQMRAVPSVYHQCLKFLSPTGEKTIHGSQKQSRACYMTGFRKMPPRQENVSLVRDLTVKDPAKDLSSIVALDESSQEKGINIGNDLPPEVRNDLLSLLKQNIKTFAWSIADMPEIDISITSHDLNVDTTFKPVKQKRRKLGPERAKTVNDEVDKLLKIGSIREVQYPDWLANPAVVKKKNGKWRVCIDFIDPNKACPKDSFPIPHINRVVEATAGHELLSFMDAFSRYNQILMKPDDQKKTSFITERGTYCYKVMQFGLKNARATYQRLVNKMFSTQLGRTMEVYIDKFFQ
ncbi:uncharacterized protein LOC106413232 [Brassica napus]|uniref:uncharacterized protein LOC106413232 n=1 Tax=Brassica napus TaxID=3708 RepID=UPI0006AB6753|nr:uncharacterized protein LOC106413232 [Brassica napus]